MARVPFQGRRSRTMAHSDPSAWERSVRKNVQLGGKYPVRISQGMSWKGHGASPGNREKRAQERAMRRQRGQALKNMKGRASKRAVLEDRLRKMGDKGFAQREAWKNAPRELQDAYLDELPEVEQGGLPYLEGAPGQNTNLRPVTKLF